MILNNENIKYEHNIRTMIGSSPSSARLFEGDKSLLILFYICDDKYIQ